MIACTLRVVPKQDAERLALEAGELDLLNSELRTGRPEDGAGPGGRRQGEGLRPRSGGRRRPALVQPPRRRQKPAARRPWPDVRFRRAVAHAVDRQAFVDTVFLGAGTPIDGPITPGNRAWHADGLPQYPYDPAKAKALLAEVGLTDRNGDGPLDLGGKPLAIELLTQRGHAGRERGSAVIAADLQKAGLTVDVVALDVAGARRAHHQGHLRRRLLRGLARATPIPRPTSITGSARAASTSGIPGRPSRPRRGRPRSIG